MQIYFNVSEFFYILQNILHILNQFVEYPRLLLPICFLNI